MIYAQFKGSRDNVRIFVASIQWYHLLDRILCTAIVYIKETLIKVYIDKSCSKINNLLLNGLLSELSVKFIVCYYDYYNWVYKLKLLYVTGNIGTSAIYLPLVMFFFSIKIILQIWNLLTKEYFKMLDKCNWKRLCEYWYFTYTECLRSSWSERNI